jgi:hypothetical protein
VQEGRTVSILVQRERGELITAVARASEHAERLSTKVARTRLDHQMPRLGDAPIAIEHGIDVTGDLENIA